MKAKKTEDNKDSAKTPGFEESLKRLETIVEEMEGGSLSLEKMLAHFEEGQGLIKLCTKKLNEVEKRVEILVKKGDALVAEPFEEPLEDDLDEAPTGKRSKDDDLPF